MWEARREPISQGIYISSVAPPVATFLPYWLCRFHEYRKLPTCHLILADGEGLANGHPVDWIFLGVCSFPSIRRTHHEPARRNNHHLRAFGQSRKVSPTPGSSARTLPGASAHTVVKTAKAPTACASFISEPHLRACANNPWLKPFTQGARIGCHRRNHVPAIMHAGAAITGGSRADACPSYRDPR